jgi:hypothetical protein
MAPEDAPPEGEPVGGDGNYYMDDEEYDGDDNGDNEGDDEDVMDLD